MVRKVDGSVSSIYDSLERDPCVEVGQCGGSCNCQGKRQQGNECGMLRGQDLDNDWM